MWLVCRHILLPWLLACCSAGAMAWPQIPLPPDATRQDLGEALNHNGTPTLSFGFTSPSAPKEVTAWLERQLGQPIVRSTRGRRMVLAKGMDGFFVTIQLEAAHPGTSGLVGIADLKTAKAQRAKHQQEVAQLRQRLPMGSVINSHATSMEQGRFSRQVVYSNTNSLAINEKHLIDMLKESGFVLERRASQDLAQSGKPGTLLFFSGPKKEAMATLSTGLDGETVVFLVTITGQQS